MMKFTFVHWLLLLFLGTLAFGCLLLAIRQFSVVHPMERRDQLRRSLKIGGLAGIFSFIIVVIVSIFIWAETGVFKSVILAFPILCLVPFVFAVSVLGAYVQFFWYAKLSKYREDLIHRQIEQVKAHKQEPKSKTKSETNH